MESRKVYVDNNATTCVHPEVLSAMLPYYKDNYGNASSIHAWGREARDAVNRARIAVAGVINVLPEEVYFTSCGTESDNWAIKGIINASKDSNLHIITTQIEHHAVLNVVKYYEKQGLEVTYLPVDKNGFVDTNELKNSIKKNTALVSVMFANNEMGTIQPIKTIGNFLKKINVERRENQEQRIYFHTDAVQAFGKVPLDVNELNVDLMSISAHKIYGPKGIGALYVRKGVKIEPMFHGGHHEMAKRAGTENVAGIIGFGMASAIAAADIEEQSKRLKKLKEKLFNGIKERIDEVYQNGHMEKSLPGTLNISFNYIEGESIIIMLDLKGIAVSSGSACTSGSLKSSHVLKAMDVSAVLAQGSIRFSLGLFNNDDDVDYILEVLPPIIERLRKMSPLYSNSK